MAVLITALAENIVFGAVIGFAVGFIIILFTNDSLENALGVCGIAMVLSFILLSVRYGRVLSNVFGPALILVVLGYAFVGVLGGGFGYVVRRNMSVRSRR